MARGGALDAVGNRLLRLLCLRLRMLRLYLLLRGTLLRRTLLAALRRALLELLPRASLLPVIIVMGRLLCGAALALLLHDRCSGLLQRLLHRRLLHRRLLYRRLFRCGRTYRRGSGLRLLLCQHKIIVQAL